MSNLKIHITYTAAIVAVASITFFIATGKFSGNRAQATASSTNIASSAADNGNSVYKLTCQKGYHLIRPLLSANQQTESGDFSSLKAKVANLVEDSKKTGLLTSATVYLYSLTDGRWMYLNPNESFHPGSLVKVPLLITFLKESEADPSVLSKKILFDDNNSAPTQTFNSQAIKKGNTYSVKELLKYMTSYSDNNATRILNNTVVVGDFLKTFTDINIPEPNVKDRNYEISAKNISEFFVVLYYGTYLSRSNSEYAMQLLSESDFKDGIVKELPASVSVAHKFGEWGDNRMGIHEIHETGIVYYNDKPYLLTVMTRGTNPKDLCPVVSSISKVVYDEIAASSVRQASL